MNSVDGLQEIRAVDGGEEEEWGEGNDRAERDSEQATDVQNPNQRCHKSGNTRCTVWQSCYYVIRERWN